MNVLCPRSLLFHLERSPENTALGLIIDEASTHIIGLDEAHV